MTTIEGLGGIPIRALLQELVRRCDAMIFVAVVTDGHPEANVRTFVGAKPGVNNGGLVVAGLLEVARGEVAAALREQGGMHPDDR